MSDKAIRLCALDEVPVNGTNGFLVETDEGRFSAMVIRKTDDIFVYVNSCPHIGSPLDIKAGQFLNQDKTHIICTTHGALFRIDDGYCVFGPCADASLTALESSLQEGEIFITLPERNDTGCSSRNLGLTCDFRSICHNPEPSRTRLSKCWGL